MKKQQFRELDALEQHAIEAMKERHKGFAVLNTVARTKGVKVHYVQQGNFTTAVVKVGRNKVAFGYAKRNPKDALNVVAGQQLAFARALKSELIEL